MLYYFVLFYIVSGLLMRQFNLLLFDSDPLPQPFLEFYSHGVLCCRKALLVFAGACWFKIDAKFILKWWESSSFPKFCFLRYERRDFWKNLVISFFFKILILPFISWFYRFIHSWSLMFFKSFYFEMPHLLKHENCMIL